jgi:hypothetical protein
MGMRDEQCHCPLWTQAASAVRPRWSSKRRGACRYRLKLGNQVGSESAPCIGSTTTASARGHPQTFSSAPRRATLRRSGSPAPPSRVCNAIDPRAVRCHPWRGGGPHERATCPPDACRLQRKMAQLAVRSSASARARIDDGAAEPRFARTRYDPFTSPPEPDDTHPPTLRDGLRGQNLCSGYQNGSASKPVGKQPHVTGSGNEVLTEHAHQPGRAGLVMTTSARESGTATGRS